ncbi:MAG: GHKL domain-containing protein [Coriobacteriales bacterium]|nr:GHKL domain-containing protein [Coriobacteriales bacterium]
MRRRIYLNFSILVFMSVVVLSTLLSLFFYNTTKDRALTEIRENARLVVGVLDNLGIDTTTASSLDSYFSFIGKNDTALRVTIIAPDGTVLYDNQASAKNMDNHADRAEVISALATGFGESTRYSNTQLTETYYYAIRFADGNVFRMSKTVSNLGGVLFDMLPVIILVTTTILLLASFLASRLTNNIVKPLMDIDFSTENPVYYDELVPFAKRIDEQQLEIANQITSLESRASTISAITNNMREGLILLDEAGKILMANRSALAIFAEWDDVEQSDILHVCRDIGFQQHVKECLTGLNTEMTWERNSRFYNLYFSPVLSGDEIAGAVVLFFDITEQHQAEIQRREFTANVSHELKTPLTSISALAEMISTGMAKEADIGGFAVKISDQARRLISIIDGIIRLSEFDEGMSRMETTSFDLYELAVMVIGVMQAQAAEKGVTVNLVGDRFEIKANRQMIEELLYNLIDNAIKYNYDDGSVSVSLSLIPKESLVRISVRDSGIGIPLVHQNNVFQRFYRVDRSRNKKTGGTGLGLSIVKHVVEHHGGYVELSSSEKSGTTVTCYIPALWQQPR